MRTTQNNLPLECEHRRRIIHTPTYARIGSEEKPSGAFLAYCTECFWYQGGELSDIAVAWIEHMEEMWDQADTS